MMLSLTLDNSQSSNIDFKAIDQMNFYLKKKDKNLCVGFREGHKYIVLNSKSESIDSIKKVFAIINIDGWYPKVSNERDVNGNIKLKLVREQDKDLFNKNGKELIKSFLSLIINRVPETDVLIEIETINPKTSTIEHHNVLYSFCDNPYFPNYLFGDEDGKRQTFPTETIYSIKLIHQTQFAVTDSHPELNKNYQYIEQGLRSAANDIRIGGISFEITPSRDVQNRNFLLFFEMLRMHSHTIHNFFVIQANYRNLKKLPEYNRYILDPMDAESTVRSARLHILRNKKEFASITDLDLSGLGLTHLPPDIGLFVGLRNLNLNGNHIQELPESIGNLKNLTSLSLSGNQVSILPQSLEQCRELQFVDLMRNPLTSTPTFLPKNCIIHIEQNMEVD